MSNTIGELVVNLKANTASFVSELDKSRTKAAAFGVAIGSVMANVAESIAVMAKNAAMSVPRLVASVIDLSEELGKSAQKAGVTVEKLSALNFAAYLSDVSLEDLTLSLGRLSKNILDAAQGTGTAKEAFHALGISLKDSHGNLKSAGTVLEELAGKFAQMSDGSQKTALAIQVFGRSGASLIPLLNEDSKGLAAAAKEADQLGNIIGKETTESAKKFNDNVKELKKSVTGLGIALASALLPTLISTTNAMLEWVKAVRALPAAFSEEVEKMKSTWEKFQRLIIKAGGLGSLDIQMTGFRGKGASGSWEGPAKKTLNPPVVDEAALKKQQELIKQLRDAIAPADELAKGILALKAAGASTSEIIGGLSDKIVQAAKVQLEHGKSLPPVIQGLLAESKAYQYNIVQLGALTDEFIKLSDEMMKASLQQKDFKSIASALGFDENGMRSFDEGRVSVLEFFDTLTGKIDTFKVVTEDFGKEIFAGWDKLEVSSRKVGESLDAFHKRQAETGQITIRQYNELLKTQKIAETLKEAGKDMADVFAQGFQDAILRAKTFGDALRNIGKELAAIAFNVAVTKPLTNVISGLLGKVLGGLFGGVGGGAAAASPLSPVSVMGSLAGGGPVQAYSPYLVGERGPETFVPASSGRIVPNSAPTIVYNIDARGAAPGTDRAIVRSLRATHDAAVRNALVAQKENTLRSA